MAAQATTDTATSAPQVETPAAPQEGGLLSQLRAAFEAKPGERSEEAPVPPPAEQAAPSAEKPAEGKPPAGGKTLSAEELAKRQASIQLAAEKRKIAQERDQLTAQLKEYQDWKAIKESKDAWAQLKLLGYEKPEEFTAALAEGAMTPERKQLMELQQWRQEREQQEQKQAYQAQLDTARNTVVEFLNKDEKFELSRLNNGPDIVLAVIQQLYQQLPDPSSARPDELIAQAAQHVEDYLGAEAQKLWPVLSKRFGNQKAAPSAPSAPSASRQPPRTISSKMSAVTAPAGDMSDEDRAKWLAEELKKQFVR